MGNRIRDSKEGAKGRQDPSGRREQMTAKEDAECKTGQRGLENSGEEVIQQREKRVEEQRQQQRSSQRNTVQRGRSKARKNISQNAVYAGTIVIIIDIKTIEKGRIFLRVFRVCNSQNL